MSFGLWNWIALDLRLSSSPLLADPKNYVPDEVDLNADPEALKIWLSIMEDSIKKVAEMAISSQRFSMTASERASLFRKNFLAKIHLLREKPFAYGSANIRNLLDLREQILNEHGFDDAYSLQKEMENSAAVRSYTNVIANISKIQDFEQKWILLSRGMLAGNVFDWGAEKVIQLMQRAGGLSFDEALQEIEERPWLHDGLDKFLSNLSNANYKCAVIFVDNSGADFVLGILPFARELASFGIKVIVVSNLYPALNDLTYTEMLGIVSSIRAIDPVVDKHIENGQLLFTHHGQGSPCLDFRRIHSDLNELVIFEKVDLVIIEGMGRSLHTNFSAKFTCDSLKVAVIKTQWLADRLNGKLFSVVFKLDEGCVQED
ncbi:unnamed protein product [Caenorhabditis auriculariae]|uniref:4'-phosphopantetheine phosphatase n=1 Tax=Caenorhabditis auriculariae TaxID=2777116 RepID=A0A8S1GUZ7_9PELO|nr:unnamed protein product [Caenorhabditis auriculariae]